MRYLFAILFSFFILHLNAQEKDYLQEMYAEHHTIQQIEGTSELLREYIAPYSEGEKELFAILFTPQICPRCESDINYIIDNINAIKPEAKTILIAAYPDAELAKEYVQQFHTKNIIIDANNSHEQIFHYRTGRLAVCYFLKIDIEKGRLICGGSSSTLNNDFLSQFCSNTTYMPLFSKTEEPTTSPDIQKNTVPNDTYNYIFVQTNKGKNISEVLELPQWQGNAFLYSDELASKGRLFSIKNDTAYLEKEIYPTESQEKMFVQLPDSTYNKLKHKGYICIMANTCAFIPDTEQAIVSYSLPELFMKGKDNVAYFNHAAFLSLQKGDSISNVIDLDFELDSLPSYMYIHTFPFFPINDRYAIIACQRGFPITAELEDLQNDSTSIYNNIFLSDFYKYSPYCAIFDMQTGKLMKRFGKLSDIFQKTKTGYYFTTPVADVYKDMLIYGDGFSGELLLTDTINCEVGTKIKLFDVTIENLSQRDSLLYTEGYFDAFFTDFNRQITMVKLDSEGIHCLIRNGKSAVKDENDTYEYILLGYNGKLINKYPLIPEESDNILSYGLGINTNKKVFPYYFCKNKNGSYLKLVTNTQPSVQIQT